LDDNNPLDGFLKEICEITGDKADTLTADRLFLEYNEYENITPKDKKSKKWFSQQMLVNGHKSIKCKSGFNRDKVVYYGIKFKVKECMIEDVKDDLEN
jgi:hypothetical protein